MIFERKTVVVGWDVVYGNLDCEGRSVVSQELIYTANTKEAAEEFLTTRGWKKGATGALRTITSIGFVLGSPVGL